MCEVNEYNNINDILIKSKINADTIRFENITENKLIVYNLNTYSPLQKCWIYIDRCKIVKKMIGGILIGFSLKNSIIEIINHLELTIKDKYKSVLNYNKSITVNDITIPTLELTIDDDTRYFNHSDELINYFDDSLLSKNYSKRNIKEIGLIIELDYIEITNDRMMFYWRVVQLRENKKIDVDISIFKTLEKEIVNNQVQRKPIHIPINPILNHVNQINDPVLPPYIPPDKRTNVEETTSPAISTRPVVLSPDQLQSAIKKLKTINRPKNNKENNSDTQEIQEKPTLKHVETREKSPIELYNLEKENEKIFSEKESNDSYDSETKSETKTKCKKSKKSKK